jgi:amino acid transporter
MSENNSQHLAGRLRRDLGTLESYAALIGILIGAGIFKVTSQAWALTGPSVILGYVLLMPAILATSVPYAAFISTPLGREPGGEYLHISRTLGGFRLAYIGSWLKIIAYVGAGAYLASALSDYIIEFSGRRIDPQTWQLPLAIASLLFFYVIHVVGVKWFGRIQVAMCALLGLSIVGCSRTLCRSAGQLFALHNARGGRTSGLPRAALLFIRRFRIAGPDSGGS